MKPEHILRAYWMECKSQERLTEKKFDGLTNKYADKINQKYVSEKELLIRAVGFSIISFLIGVFFVFLLTNAGSEEAKKDWSKGNFQQPGRVLHQGIQNSNR